MCPSTEATDAESEFAAEVLRNLLGYIDCANKEGRPPFLVTHAWTAGPMMYLVYKAPPSQITWGLVRDTRESNINPGPWVSLDEAVVYYYITDLEEDRMSASYRHPGEPDTILWYGDQKAGLPKRPSDIPEAYRYTPSTGASSAKHGRDQDQPVITEPRRYGNPQ
jgi:hypothetical protein